METWDSKYSSTLWLRSQKDDEAEAREKRVVDSTGDTTRRALERGGVE